MEVRERIYIFSTETFDFIIWIGFGLFCFQLMLDNRFKENWLIVLGLISLCAAIGFIIIFKEEKLFPRGIDPSSYSFVIFALSAVIFAPLVEELSFRGFYTSKRIFIIISIFLLPVFLFFAASEYWFVLAIFYLFLFLHYKLNRPWIWKVSIVMNVLLFASMHYGINDIIGFKAYTFLFQFAFGFLSVWIVINFNLFKAMIAHFVWNAVVVSILFFSIQFPDETVNTYNNELFTASWSKVPYFRSKQQKYFINDHKVMAENVTAKKLDDFLSSQFASPNSSSDTYQPEPFMKYDLIIQLKDSVSKQDLRLITKEFLEEQNLLIYK